MIFAVGLQDDGDDGHDGFDDAELQSCLENTLQFRRQTRQQSGCVPNSEMMCDFVCNKIKQDARGERPACNGCLEDGSPLCSVPKPEPSNWTKVAGMFCQCSRAQLQKSRNAQFDRL